ncbi:MAG TPA: hypothetical protein VJX66_20895 [Amycolatopsis sp.]|nr:hypothetical protein [Amycolatopsis sp.]
MAMKPAQNRTKAARAAMAAAIAGPAFIAVALAPPASAQGNFNIGSYGSYNGNDNSLYGGPITGNCAKPGDTVHFTGLATDEGDGFTGNYNGNPTTRCDSNGNWSLNGNYNGNVGVFGGYNQGDTDLMNGVATETDSSTGALVGVAERTDEITAQ